MLAVLFSLGNERCGLDATVVERVVPAPPLQAIPGAPAALAGTFSYHGNNVPVIDLARLLLNRPTKPYLSSRFILVRHEFAEGGLRLLALLAEGVNEVRNVYPSSTGPDSVRVVTVEELLPPGLLKHWPANETAAAVVP